MEFIFNAFFFIYLFIFFFVKQFERVEIYQYVLVDTEISWSNSEKFYGQGIEDGEIMRQYPENDGRDHLVTNIIICLLAGGSLEEARMESGGHQGAGMPPGSLYNSTGGGAPRSNSSSSSASPPASAPTPSVNAAAMLVVPQPINASKMSGQPQGSIVSANGGTGRKYQCKMCPQVSKFNYYIQLAFSSSLLLHKVQSHLLTPQRVIIQL